MSNQILAALREATDDLLYMSESDEPFELVDWPEARGEPHGEGLRKCAGYEQKDTVAELSLDDFFEQLTEEKKWHSEAERRDVHRYRKLKSVIENQLSSAKVFRIGETQVDIFIVGRTPEGHWAGVKTKAVET